MSTVKHALAQKGGALIHVKRRGNIGTRALFDFVAICCFNGNDLNAKIGAPGPWRLVS
jgi:hypothetical protein